MDLAAAALAYAALGWPVFPCEPRGKRPLGALAPHGVKDASTDPAVIRAWWATCPSANVALACGVAFWVSDVDGPEGRASLGALCERHGRLPLTVTSRTGSGGWHLLFALPDGCTIRNSARRLGPGLDTRAAGGYVVAPPSIHPTGGRYRWLEGRDPWSVPLAEAPPWLLDLLVPPEMPRPAAPCVAIPLDADWGPKPRYSRAALDRACRRILDAAKGEQCKALYAQAAAMARLAAAGFMPEGIAKGALLAAGLAMTNHDPRRPWRKEQVERDIARGWAAGIVEPRRPGERR